MNERRPLNSLNFVTVFESVRVRLIIDPSPGRLSALGRSPSALAASITNASILARAETGAMRRSTYSEVILRLGGTGGRMRALAGRRAALVQSTATLEAETLVRRSGTVVADPLYRSVWQGIRTCSSPDGYTSTGTRWQGMTNGWATRATHGQRAGGTTPPSL